MKNKILFFILLLPLLCFSEPRLLCFKAVTAATGHYDPISSTYHWKRDINTSMAVVYDMENYIITIHSQKPVSLEILDIYGIGVDEWCIEARDKNGVYVVIIESIPDIGEHVIILNYPDYCLKYTLVPM